MALADTAPPRTRRFAAWVWTAAAAAIVLGVVLPSGLRRTPSRAAETRVISTPAGERRVVHLSDSSVITLGPSTTLRFTLTDKHRDVQLEGLAEFRVVHDSTRPFVVQARDAIATDIGTEFVVRAYATDSVVRVAVTSGEVSLTGRNAGAPAITLKAGDVGLVASHDVQRATKANAVLDVAWVDGGLSFDNEPLSHVAAELARWFDADIRIADSALANHRVSAVYNNATLAGVLDALATTAKLDYSRSGRTITLRPRAAR